MERSKEYKKRIKEFSPHSSVIKNSLSAFVFGGTICLIGELMARLFMMLNISKDNAYILVSVNLILLSAILTGLGIYDSIAKHAGAGTLIPVTGFANAVVSPAIDTRSEGLILGVGSKIFTVAGPVILYGILSGVLYGVIYFITNLFIF